MKILDFEQALCGRLNEKLSGTARQIFTDYLSGNIFSAYKLSVDIYKNEIDLELRSFWLHFLCVITEVQYNLESRRVWMNKWPQQLALDGGDFARAAARYHQANTCYFESHFVEALNRYKELADHSATPTRFKALAHFHLGLIYQQRQLLRAARNEMRTALTLAEQIGHLRLISRVREQLTAIDSETPFSLLDSEICRLITEENLSDAKKLYTKKRELEKSRGIQRGQSSLHALIPAMIAISGSSRHRIHFALEFIHDPAIKIQSIRLLQSIGYNSPELRSLYEVLSSDLGILPDEFKKGIHDQFLDRPLKEIPQEDLQKFTRYIISESSVDKEGICHHVWNIEYDPVIHDGKVYKLIHRFRDYFGKKDLIVNRYGKYEVNQKYRA